jgi:hypothetical protein
MAPQLERQTTAERQNTLTNADNSMANVVREYNTPGTNPQQQQQRSNDLAGLNGTLETSGVIPGLTITDMHSSKPGDPNAPEAVTMQTSDPTTGGRVLGDAQYNPQTHQLAFDRTPVLPGTKKPEPPTEDVREHVTVDMLTGRETVTAPGENGTTRTTTRDSVGAEDPTTVVTAPANGKPEVVQTEATDKNGATMITQYQYDNGGNLKTYTPPGGQQTEVPAGSTVDQKTGVLFATQPDGTKIDVTPQGRIFTTDPTGKTSYIVKPGDTLWDVSRDLAKVQGNLTPSDTDIQGLASQIGHAGDNHNPNAIKAGETINFGVGTRTDATGQADPNAQGDNLDLTKAKPSDAPSPPAPAGWTANPGNPNEWDRPGGKVDLPPGAKNVHPNGDNLEATLGNVTLRYDKDGHLKVTSNGADLGAVGGDNVAFTEPGSHYLVITNGGKPVRYLNTENGSSLEQMDGHWRHYTPPKGKLVDLDASFVPKPDDQGNVDLPAGQL